MKRRRPLTTSLEQVQAWKQLTRERQMAAMRDRGKRGPSKSQRRRNDAAWRAECLERRGNWCRVPGCRHPQPVQMDHMISRAQGGPSVVENGLPLCRVHHEMKTNHDLLIDPAWLDHDQIDWLGEQGHAEWCVDGVVVGRHCRLFADGPDRRNSETK